VVSAQGNIIAGGNLVVSGTTQLIGAATAPTAPTGTANNQVATTAFVANNGVPSGCILLWSGSIISIPSGWYLCDGTNSTPDLRDRFIVGAGSTYAVNATGGSANAVVVAHTHTATSTVTDPGHLHPLPTAVWASSGSSRWSGSAGPIGITVPATNSATTGISVSIDAALNHTHSLTLSGNTQSAGGTSGSTQPHENRPPYYALCYIQKMY
jgi:microcystin-dependent protein